MRMIHNKGNRIPDKIDQNQKIRHLKKTNLSLNNSNKEKFSLKYWKKK